MKKLNKSNVLEIVDQWISGEIKLDTKVRNKIEKLNDSLVEIPSYVAEFIEADCDPIMNIIVDIEYLKDSGNDVNKSKVYSWFLSNKDDYFNAVVNGYRVKDWKDI